MLQGSIVSLVTPFTKEGELDVIALRELVSWHIEEGSDAIVCLATTGEISTLSDEEQDLAIEVVVKEVKKQIPVIVGTGFNCTRTTIQRTKRAKELGADGALVIVPYCNKPSFEGCFAHFTEVARVGLPIIIYHHPGRTGLTISPVNMAQLCAIPNVVALKETSGDISYVLEVQKYSSVTILSGDDHLTLPLISIGAKGVISIVANVIPKEWKLFLDACLQEDFSKALEYSKKYYRLCKSLVLENNPQCVKYAVSLLDKIEPIFRLPLVEPKEGTKQEIGSALEDLGFFSKADV